jgi:hypothetical protein
MKNLVRPIVNDIYKRPELSWTHVPYGTWWYIKRDYLETIMKRYNTILFIIKMPFIR